MVADRLETRVGVALVAPAVIGLLVLNYYPIIQSTLYSLFALDSTTDWLSAQFVGLRNYADVMQSDQFWYTFGFTVGFTVVVVTLDLSLGMLLALATFYVPKRMRGVLRAIIIVPWAIPKVIQASMWRWMLNSDVGPIGDLLVRIGIVSEPPLFLVDRFLAMASVVVAYTWKGSSIAAFFLMGGLALIPREVIESATVDGARAVRRFFSIVLPIVMPTVYVALLYRSQDALRVFDVIYGLTGGGPGTTTDTLSSFAYTAYFRYAQFGRASTYAVVTFVLVAAVGVFYIGRVRRNFSFKE
ncbi:MAG: sugar ABC transporter permease [Spirochaetaceae bacterium]|nr:MAG: sugar ABC transporter permease [Spirochaetaceae bacterium]